MARTPPFDGGMAPIDWQEHLAGALADASQDGILVLRSVRDNAGRISDFECLLANPVARQMLGYRAGEGAGNCLGKVLPGIADNAFLSAARAVAEGSEQREWEKTALLAGRTCRLRIQLTKYQDGCIAILREIGTPRPEEGPGGSDQALMWSVFETLPHFVYVKDTQRRYLLVNRHVRELIGLRSEDMIGRTNAEIPQLLSEAQPIFDAQDEDVLAGRTPLLAAEVDWRLPDGRMRHVRVHKAPLHDAQGRIAGLIGVSQDVSGEHAAALALAKSEERFRNLVEGSLQGVAILRDYRPVFCNQSYADMFGYRDPQELLSAVDSVFTLIAPHEHARLTQLARDRAQGLSVPDHYEAECVRRDGSHFWVFAFARIVQWEEETATQITLFDITDRKLAEKALAASEERFRNLVDGSVQGVAVHRKFKWLYCNQAFADMLGYRDPAEVMAMESSLDILPEHERERVLRLARDRAQGAMLPERYELEFLRKDGSRIWAYTMVRLVDWDGSRAFQATVFDITERKRAEQALRASEGLLKVVLDTLPHIVTVKDTQGKILLVNKAKAEAHGLRPEDLIGRRSEDLPWPDPQGLAVARVADAQMLESAEPVQLTGVELRDLQGNLTIRNVLRAPLLDEHRTVTGIVGVTMDVTAEVRARQEAQLALARLVQAIESFPGGFSLWDPELRLVLANSKVKTLLPHVGPNLVPGVRFGDMVRESNQNLPGMTAEQLERHVAEMTAEFLQSVAVEHQYGERWVRMMHSQVAGGGVIAILLDITDVKRKEEELRQAHKMEAIGQITGGLAHDFNNLLTVILGNAELLLNELPAEGTARTMADTVMRAALRGSDLTKRLLAYARRQPLEVKQVDLNRIVADMSPLIERTLGAAIAIEHVLADNLWATAADPSQVENALLNLAVNARDAMPSGGKLSIETGNAVMEGPDVASHPEIKPGRYVMLAVSDTGTGMTPEVLERAFDPFFTTKSPGHGSGLGLSMVYGFARQSGGHIQIQSELGRGTAVKLYLPYFEYPAGPAPHHAALDSRAPGGTETVLLVEDDDAVRDYACSALKSLGYTVMSAADAKAGLVVLSGPVPVHLLFTDIMMPGGMNGRELSLHALRLRPGLKVLFTSGYAENVIAHEGRLDSGVEFLAKPYDRIGLARKVRQVLDSA